MPRKLPVLLFLLTCSLVCRPLMGQQLAHQADSIISTVFSDPTGPGGVFMIAHKGKVIYQKSAGKANLELQVDLRPEHVFQLGSMTKQFTAVAVLMLEQEGKLKTTDPISAYIPDYPNGNHITIHHLLTHTSGIRDFTKMKTISTIANREMTPKMMVDFFKDEPCDFAPGEKFDYNNSGYVLLGYIMELVSGETYEHFIAKRIFEKAGMTDSYYCSDRKVITNRAYGYHKKGPEYVNKTVISYSLPYASGALMSTLKDMLKWQHALNTNLLLNKEESEKAFRAYQLNNGTPISYGYGWHIRDINGTPDREHGGSIFGYKSMGVYIPGEDIYVLALSNCDCNSPTKVAQDIAAMALRTLRKQK